MGSDGNVAVLRERVQPLLEALRPVHGEGLLQVIAYGPLVAEPRRRDEPLTVLVVLADASSARLRQSAPAVGQLRRAGIEPLFLARGEIEASLDVFPLEFLEMQALYTVIEGEDILAELVFPPEALRLQVEEDLRAAAHWLRQELARHGHRARLATASLAQSFATLTRVWRGLLTLRGDEVPALPEPLREAAAEALGLDRELLHRLAEVEAGTLRLDPPDLDQLVDAYDALLASLVARVDSMDTDG